MKVAGQAYRTISPQADGSVRVIDQSRLPHAFEVATLRTAADAERAIRDMVVRGAPLIGATAAYGVALAMGADPSGRGLAEACARLLATRPTAVNLRWALDRMAGVLRPRPPGERADAAWAEAARICDEDVAACAAIGDHGREAIARLAAGIGDRPVNILTHCNAGWLATVDWGTALSPVYKAHRAGVAVHVWVDETRPRNQGASLTMWELAAEGVPCTLIPDNAGGHLMQHGQVDLCIVGSDRTTSQGDVCNKIGTYLKALAAADNGVPFFAALPGSTLDWTIADGVAGIEIEQRAEDEVTHATGLAPDGEVLSVRLAPQGCRAANYGFDVTPARLVTGGLITERGIAPASAEGLAGLFPEYAPRPAQAAAR
jgi:methylthioribose-1-phosphate isomerase